MDTFKLFLVFDRRKNSAAKGYGSVEVCIMFNRSSRLYAPTGVELYPSQWDAASRMATGPGARDANHRLSAALADCRSILTDMQCAGEDMTAENYKRHRNRIEEEKTRSFFDFAYDCMQTRQITASTRKTHACALEALRRSGIVKTVQDLTADNIARFDRWLRSQNPNMEQTTLHNYHKRIKVYVNEAIRAGLLERSPYDRFHDVRGRSKDRVALTDEELIRIRSLQLHDPSLERARDTFVFCCYTGLSYADLNHLTPDQFCHRDGRTYISADRQKTHTHFFTPVLPPAMQILARYNNKLPVYSQQSYNRLLKLIAHLAGIVKPLSSHIARHTFATTVVLANDIPIETLSKMLGHRNIAVTQIYAKVLDQTISRHSDKLFRLLEDSAPL